MRTRKELAVRDQALTAAVQSTPSLRRMLQTLGLSATGTNYRLAKQRIVALGVDTSHWTGQSHRRGSTTPVVRAQPLDALLIERSQYTNATALKTRLIRERVLACTCAECGLGNEWRGKPLTLVLDHINGVNTDWRRENLRLLCPNCNSQTPTLAGRNRRGVRSAVVA